MSFQVRYLGFVKGDGQSVFSEYQAEKVGRLNEVDRLINNYCWYTKFIYLYNYKNEYTPQQKKVYLYEEVYLFPIFMCYKILFCTATAYWY
jgi:hypothetical protein